MPVRGDDLYRRRIVRMFRRTIPLGIVLPAPAIGTIFFPPTGQFIWDSVGALRFVTLR